MDTARLPANTDPTVTKRKNKVFPPSSNSALPDQTKQPVDNPTHAQPLIDDYIADQNGRRGA